MKKLLILLALLGCENEHEFAGDYTITTPKEEGKPIGIPFCPETEPECQQDDIEITIEIIIITEEQKHDNRRHERNKK